VVSQHQLPDRRCPRIAGLEATPRPRSAPAGRSR
jgi:hypothetical protein